VECLDELLVVVEGGITVVMVMVIIIMVGGDLEVEGMIFEAIREVVEEEDTVEAVVVVSTFEAIPKSQGTRIGINKRFL